MNSCEFKIDDFNFRELFTKINDIDKVLQLLSALLLEKKVILIKKDISDVPVLIQTLISLLAPFKWNYPLITDLPISLIEALESPMPFLIAIQKSVWDNECQVQMMDNVQQENFVIFDIDENKSRGLTDIYDPQASALANIQLQKVLKKKYQQLLSMKDELLQSLTGKDPDAHQINEDSAKQKGREALYSDEKADELYWVWFQLKIKQGIHHLYLSMLGNIQAGFKSKEELGQLEEAKGGYMNLSVQDIFDFDKYLRLMKLNNSGNKFIEAFV